MCRTLAEKRHNDWTKAIRKQKICKERDGSEWYPHLHQYSKGKIHCSCPICAAKTNPKRKRIGHGYTRRDYRRIEEMKYEEDDYE